MTRILIHVEGPTEEAFVNSVLRPHLYDVGFTSVGARLLGNSRTRARRGGIRSWEVVREEIRRHLVTDTGAVATTMVDYYALPETWPGRTNAPALPASERGFHVQEQLAQDFDDFCQLGHRFLPFVLMHEYEGLLFSDCESFANGIGHPQAREALQSIRDLFETPEHINDSPQTAPSKRLKAVIPGYQKPLFGAVGALEIGIQAIRDQCPHFADWLMRLEQHEL